jgi:hypothetical protein
MTRPYSVSYAGSRERGVPVSNPLPEGWVAGCRDEDRFWVHTFGAVASVRDVRFPVEAVPYVYPSYNVVLHRLADGTEEGRRWLTGVDVDPWERVSEIVHHGLAELGRFAGDCPLWHEDTAQTLADALAIAADDSLYTCTFFPITEQPVVTLTGAALRLRLGQQQALSNGVRGPLLWFPYDRRWVASSPYDQGFTYVASDEATAAAPHAREDLEVLPCSLG